MKQVDGALQVQSDSWLVEPSPCFPIASQHFSSPLMDLGMASRCRRGTFEALVKNPEEARESAVSDGLE
jgi:hypothetical protein